MRLPKGLAMTLADGFAPAITRWAMSEERRILCLGEPLSDEMAAFAAELGIRNPEKIRVMIVQEIPLPVPAWCVRLGKRLGLPVFAPGGMALGWGIFLLPGQMGSLAHELVHVAQYERLGGIGPFMRRYLTECMEHGYDKAPLEKEAQGR